jgi:hypothetical protein
MIWPVSAQVNGRIVLAAILPQPTMKPGGRMGYRRRAASLLLSAAMASAVGVGLSGTAHASITDAPGYVHLKNRESGTCIDAQSAAPGTGVVMWRCLNTAYEEWQKSWVSIPESRYDHCGCISQNMLRNHAMDLCLALADESGGSGTPVVQATCDASDPRQWWTLYIINNSTPTYRVQSYLGDEKILDVDLGRSDNGVPLQIWTNDFTNNQEWRDANGNEL